MNISFRSLFVAATMVLPLLIMLPKQAAQASGQRQIADAPRLLADSNEDEQQRLNPQRLRPYSNDYEYQQHKQDEANRLNAAPNNQYPSPPQGMSPQSRAQSEALEAARRNWQKQPPLPDDRNPLLGKWKRPPSSNSNSSDPFAQLGAMMKGGLCEVLFGGGVFEFRPKTLVGMDQGTREQELDQVEYRGDAHHVAVIPKTTFKLMVFDFDGPDRINWSGQNCVLIRVSRASTEHRPDTAGAADTAKGSGILNITVATSKGNSGFTPIPNHELWILKESAEVILLNVGVKSSNYGSVLQVYAQACQYHFPMCERGMQEIKAHSVAFMKTDAAGSASIASLPVQGSDYYVFTNFVLDNKPLMWNVPIRLKAGANALTLDQRNATSAN